METAPDLEPTTPATVDLEDADRKTALVTGSNGGVGLALAKKLASDGWRVLIHGRNASKLAQARTALGIGGPHEALRADLSDLEDVRRLASQVKERTDRLDVLVHNAGLLSPGLEVAPSGVEMTMAVNALAPFVLTNALRPLLERTSRAHGSARVVTVSSEAHRGGRISTTDPEALAEALQRPRGRYFSIKAYAQSKIIATAWTFELARRLEDVTANACHPGLVRTGVFGGFGPVLGPVLRLFSPLYLPPRIGAESPYLLATAPKYAERTGQWVTRSHLRGPHEATASASTRDPAVGSAVWDALSLVERAS